MVSIGLLIFALKTLFLIKLKFSKRIIFLLRVIFLNFFNPQLRHYQLGTLENFYQVQFGYHINKKFLIFLLFVQSDQFTLFHKSPFLSLSVISCWLIQIPNVVLVQKKIKYSHQPHTHIKTLFRLRKMCRKIYYQKLLSL